MKDWHIFSSKNPDSYMMLGLLNTLQNNSTISKKERDSIYSLGYCIEEIGKVKDAKKVQALLKDLIEKINTTDPDLDQDD